MKEKKYSFANLSLYDRGTTRRKLEKMASQGWMIEKLGAFLWEYRPMEPKKMHFEVMYFPNGSPYDPAPTEEEQQLEELCSRHGWKLALRSGQVQIYYNEQPDPVPIETDPVTQVENIRRTVKKGLFPAMLGYLVLGVYLLVLGLGQFWKNADWFFTQPGYLCNALLGTSLTVFAMLELLRYLRWQRKAVTMAENGEFYEQKGRNTAQWIQFGIIVICLLFCFWNTSMRLILPAIGVVLGVVVISQIAFRVMKKQGVSRKVNKLGTMFITLLAGFVLLGVMVAVTLRKDPAQKGEVLLQDGREVTVYSQEIPLRIEDYAQVPEIRWSTQKDGGGTVFAQQYQYCQRPVEMMNDIDPLDYKITKSRFPWVLEQCKKSELKKRSDRTATEKDPWVDYYEPMDPALWGAEEAYVRMREDGPWGQYLLFYPGQMVELNLYCEPTEQQMQTIGQVLKEAN